MTSKEFVKSVYPNAVCQKVSQRYDKPHFLIRTKYDESMYFSIGNTETEAWNNAKQKIQDEKESA